MRRVLLVLAFSFIAVGQETQQERNERMFEYNRRMMRLQLEEMLKRPAVVEREIAKRKAAEYKYDLMTDRLDELDKALHMYKDLHERRQLNVKKRQTLIEECKKIIDTLKE